MYYCTAPDQLNLIFRALYERYYLIISVRINQERREKKWLEFTSYIKSTIVLSSYVCGSQEKIVVPSFPVFSIIRKYFLRSIAGAGAQVYHL